MKFLLNMNISGQLGERLNADGHQCRHVRDIGMAKSADVEIVLEAKSRNEVIITHDLDYGELIAFSGEVSPSVIIFRLRNTSLENLYAKIINLWTVIEKPLLEGSIVVM